jgi:hypothetical protein
MLRELGRLGIAQHDSPDSTEGAEYPDAMVWATPLYSKRKVDAAGRSLLDPASAEDRELALAVINNWRQAHGFPLNTFQVTLRTKARQVGSGSEPLIAQRTKRLASIELKLRRFRGMTLSRMQDIGGCRAVLPNIAHVDALNLVYQRSSFRHTLVKETDYLRFPKASGYRSIHRIYRYYSTNKPTYNGLQIEVQLRSRLQHAWATAVETVGTFIHQALKSSQGEEEWLRFFALMGSALALVEGTATVPETPTTRADIRDELQHYVEKLDVIARLRAYGDALQFTEHIDGLKGAHFFLLQLNAATRSLVISGYPARDLARAQQEYIAIERAIAQDANRDAVLVSVESLAALRRAYPNYFLDTSVFLRAVEKAIR